MTSAPYFDKRWALMLHDISYVFDFAWDSVHGYWTIVQHRIGMPDWTVMSIANADGSYRPINSSALRNLQFNIWVATGEYHKWAKRELDKEGYRREKRDADEYDEALQAGKEIAPLLRTMKDAGTTSIHGRSKFRFPGFGDSKIFGGVQ